MSARDEALRRLEEFLPAVPRYGRERNYVRAGYQEVSRLSHWIRYRVITEEECARAVMARYSLSVAEKFIQEILWRTYWKGWLEMRPSVWSTYHDEVALLREQYQKDSLYLGACEGQTKLSFFNDWVAELKNTGYLHNHTRMWFASVWIFTLKLPWQLGASLMYHHLLDGDPASNTLSWRWVAGRHTAGKIYLARPDNIATFSEGRWVPSEGQLAVDAVFNGPEGVNHPPCEPLREVSTAPPPPGSIILLHDDDLSADLAGEWRTGEGSPLHGKTQEATQRFRYAVLDLELTSLSERVRAHITRLRADTATRVEAPLVRTAEELFPLVKQSPTPTVHTFIPPVGEGRIAVEHLAEQLELRGVSVGWHRRVWDTRYMPAAGGGFFGFWGKVRRDWEAKNSIHWIK